MRKVAWGVAAGGGLLLVADAFLALVAWSLGHPPLEDPVRIGPPPLHYRVGVLGDAQKGIRNLANVLEAVKRQNADFLIQTGDFVSSNDEGHYRLVALALTRAGVGRPVVVPGNHDVKGDPSRFIREFGDLERRWTWGQVKYVTVNNASGLPPDLRHLDEWVPKEGPVVLAMHVPPFDVKGNVQPGYEPFLAWLEKSSVRYLLCGHVHGYFRKQVGPVTVIVNGVGGDFDKWQFDQRVYVTILEVDGTSIADRSLDFPPEHGVWENVEHLAVGHLTE
ncbi:MAG TPA: metallophosphoesterase, partial [Planctomycetota bacterium]|nr:metallophosphoesterase [Planctomycetota bacterium]